jgi:hypothetical protein
MRWARAKSRFLRPTSRTSPLPPKSLVQAQQRHPVQARERSGDDRDTAIHLVLPSEGPECSHDLTLPGTADSPRRSDPLSTGDLGIVTRP